MRALHIMYLCGTRDVGGAAAAATRLHLQMLASGDESRVVCVWCHETIPFVSCLWNRWWWFGVRILHALTRRWIHRLDLPGFARLMQEYKPDEVHLHWIQRDTISWHQLKTIQSRLYVHLHDLWPLAQKEITSLNPTFIAYSDYVARVVFEKGYSVERRSLILDPIFQKKESSGFSADTKSSVILFGCNNGRANSDKGFSDLVAALNLLPDEIKEKLQLHIFGEDFVGEGEKTAGIKTLFLGRINDSEELKRHYSSAMCFAFPSTSETMGMTKLEALACGCPVLAFARTACAEGIDHLKNGYVAKNIADYARGLLWCMGEDETSVMKIAVLMTCHNRKDTTVDCLRRFENAKQRCAKVNCRVFLVDDGCTDGTVEAVQSQFPFVSIRQGSGNLFWAAGMRLAWEAAVQEGVWDAFLWLNDDSLLMEDSLSRLIEKMTTENIVVGNLHDSSGRQIYGLDSTGFFNGNCVLVSSGAYNRLGMSCGDYHHARADREYARRALKERVPVVSVDGVGTTEWHSFRPSLENTTLKERWRLLFEPKGWNLHDLWLYRKRNWNVFCAIASCLHFILYVLLYPFHRKFRILCGR